MFRTLQTEKKIFLQTFDVLPSTNRTARALAEEGAPERTVVIADRQTAGRGRLSRTFFSPDGTGLYMSLVLRPACTPQEAALLTPAAAVAVSEAIESVCGKEAQIKWVNDVFTDSRKVCGILAESACTPDAPGARLSYVILGIGVNVFTPPDGFPDELRAVAGAIFPDCPDEAARDAVRQRLAASILDRFLRLYDRLPQVSFYEAYKERLCCLNVPVRLFDPVSDVPTETVVPFDLTPRFELLVRSADNTVRALSSGEIRMKIL